ncbi:hypothetical protein EDB19DRAFT_1895379 [Suillus lakei]|nr:hypothetical protein EDB19DRAFT_1895379 [Suillus lakei]
MYSTPEERNPYVHSRIHARYRDSAAASRPTIEQIAMGLHVSCTPHLRNPCHHRHSAPSSPSHMRKESSTALIGPSPSTSTINSAGPATPDGPRSLILGYRSSSSPARVTSIASSGSGSEGTRPTTPRKSVRFSTSVLALDNENGVKHS